MNDIIQGNTENLIKKMPQKKCPMISFVEGVCARIVILQVEESQYLHFGIHDYMGVLAVGVALRATPTSSWWGRFALPKPPVRVSRYAPY